MEALVILVVPLVAFIIWAVAYFQPKQFDPIAEQAQLEEHIARLRENLVQARQKNWDDQMISSLSRQLEDAQSRQNTRRAA